MSTFFIKATLSPITLAIMIGALLASPAVYGQKSPITSKQRTKAAQVVQDGVALGDLQVDAPTSYTIEAGDTLWDISSLFLKSPWRWPELWGMNQDDIKNPHLIYPGQTLFLITTDGRAKLTTQTVSADGVPRLKLSPRARIEMLDNNALPTLRSKIMDPFLSDPLIVDDQTMNDAPRIVSAQDGRILLTRGDRAYARSSSGDKLKDDPTKRQKQYRVFRVGSTLRDPATAEVLGIEAQYVGMALLASSETTKAIPGKDNTLQTEIIPATIDIVKAKEEIRAGDRLLPDPPPQPQSYVPHAPKIPVNARIVSIYGSTVVSAAQNQVVAINRGARDGIENGHVLTILQDGFRTLDKTDPARRAIKLPDERNGLLIVFRTFDKLSYALVLEITDGVKIGDKLVNPL